MKYTAGSGDRHFIAYTISLPRLQGFLHIFRYLKLSLAANKKLVLWPDLRAPSLFQILEVTDDCVEVSCWRLWKCNMFYSGILRKLELY